VAPLGGALRGISRTVGTALAAAILAILLAACGPATGPSQGGSGLVGFRGHALLGPSCPVVRPNDPAGADKPVAGATIHVLDASGAEIARLTTDATGGFGLAVPPGRYRLVADPTPNSFRAPAPVDVEVGTDIATVDIAFDTGIR
jgi:hypothetical protein